MGQSHFLLPPPYSNLLDETYTIGILHLQFHSLSSLLLVDQSIDMLQSSTANKDTLGTHILKVEKTEDLSRTHAPAFSGSFVRYDSA